MEDFLSQIENALDYNLYYLALQSTLTLPDICGALESSDGEASKKNYIDWYNNNFLDKASLSAEDCYYFRCSNVHQGKSMQKNSNYKRIMFIEPPTPNKIHNCILNDAFCIDLNTFCKDMINSVRTWLKNMQNDTSFKNNYNNFIRRYPNGLPPYFFGLSVIS